MVNSEILDRLKQEDEVTLLELLEITAEDLIDAFLEKIEDNEARLYRYYKN